MYWVFLNLKAPKITRIFVIPIRNFTFIRFAEKF